MRGCDMDTSRQDAQPVPAGDLHRIEHRRVWTEDMACARVCVCVSTALETIIWYGVGAESFRQAAAPCYLCHACQQAR